MPKRSPITPGQFWSKRHTLTAKDDLDQVLGAVIHLPIRYWRRNFFFTGARDHRLYDLTSGHFPKKLAAHKTHPVYAAAPLPESVGFNVCPCSTKRAYDVQRLTYIRKGCRLRHTQFTVDQKSYILRHLSFNLPPSVAYRLRFRGEVPEECIVELSRRKGGRYER